MARFLAGRARFLGEALRKALPLPVVDMLAGMRMPPEVRLPRSHFALPQDSFLFLYVFDLCSTFERKNPLAAIEAFRRAFAPEDPVALAIKVSRGSHDPQSLGLLRQACGAAGVHLLDCMMTHEVVCGLLGACDAYVSLHTWVRPGAPRFGRCERATGPVGAAATEGSGGSRPGLSSLRSCLRGTATFDVLQQKAVTVFAKQFSGGTNGPSICPVCQMGLQRLLFR